MTNIPMPDNLTRDEIIDLLLKNEYGYLPPKADKVSTAELECDESFCAGKAKLIKYSLKSEFSGKEFSFPIYYTKLNQDSKSPMVIHINFRDNVPDRYQQSEELVDRGYSIISFCYNDVTMDNDDFTDGLAGVVYPNGDRADDACGKIGLWAWAAMRVMDYALTLPEIDHEHISVAGHSRLGKTALLTGALDSRFYCSCSNDSGCSGAAISRGKDGETIADITDTFPYWFCQNYYKYAGNEDALPFDQHYLLAANCPHRVYVASAAQDLWADPKNEYKSCLLASSYFEKHTLAVNLQPNMPEVGTRQHDGYIGYHYREGKHYFSREDWNIFLDYLDNSY